MAGREMGWPEQVDLLDSVGARKAIKIGKPYYVYILFRSVGVPFYVGKGTSDRCLHHEAEARTTNRLSHKLNIIRSLHRADLPVFYCIDSFHQTEADAHMRERCLIQEIGRHDIKKGPLTNQTDGGEGTSNPSEESRQRRRDSLWGEDAEDPDRQIANRYFQRLSSVHSVTLKPVKSWKGAERLWRNRARFRMTTRQAATLAASAITNRIILEPRALLPRRLSVEGVEFIIENGVGRDMLSSDMVTLADDTPTPEILRLTDVGFRYVLSALGRDILVDAGVLTP